MRKLIFILTASLSQVIVYISVALAHNCVGGKDCLETAGYNSTLSALGGLGGLLSFLLGGNGATSADATDSGEADSFTLPGAGGDVPTTQGSQPGETVQAGGEKLFGVEKSVDPTDPKQKP